MKHYLVQVEYHGYDRDTAFEVGFWFRDKKRAQECVKAFRALRGKRKRVTITEVK